MLPPELCADCPAAFAVTALAQTQDGSKRSLLAIRTHIANRRCYGIACELDPVLLCCYKLTMASSSDCCVFEQALPSASRTVQVSKDAAGPLSDSQSFIQATVRAGGLCGCTHLHPQDKLLCWELDPSARCLTVREVHAYPRP